MSKRNKFTGRFFALMLTVMIAVSCVVSTGVFTTSAYSSDKVGQIVYNKTIHDKYKGIDSVVCEGFKNFDEEIDVSDFNIPRSDAAEIFKVTTLTHPEFFYVKTGFSYTYDAANDKVIGFFPEYTYDSSQYQSMKKAVDNETERILSLVNDSMTDAEKALVIHDELTILGRYSTDDHNKADIYDLLVDGTSVCQGYALAYSYLLSLAGIDSEIVVSVSMNHMWNKVHIGNAWYNVDVTWDDPLYDRPGHAQHTYFLLSDDAIQNLPSKHYNYTTTNKATSTKYDNSKIHTFDTRLCEINGDFYGIINDYGLADAKTMVKYDLENNKSESVKKISARWSAGQGYYWQNSFMSLEKYNDMLYYNTDKSVYSYNVRTGKTETIVQKISGTSDSTLVACYGIVLKGDGLCVALSDSPNKNSTMQFLKRIDRGNNLIGTTNYIMASSLGATQKILYGDANCDGVINVADATAVQKAVVGVLIQSDAEFISSDVNSDSSISVTDATIMQKYIVGIV